MHKMPLHILECSLSNFEIEK